MIVGSNFGFEGGGGWVEPWVKWTTWLGGRSMLTDFVNSLSDRELESFFGVTIGIPTVRFC